MGILLYLLPKRGTLTLEYKIFKSGGDVCHGSWSGDSVSFIRYDSIKEAQMSKSLLQTFSTAEFVNPKMVISKPNVWLMVQKIDSTLDQFKEKNTRIWSRDDLLDDKYKIIVRYENSLLFIFLIIVKLSCDIMIY